MWTYYTSLQILMIQVYFRLAFKARRAHKVFLALYSNHIIDVIIVFMIVTEQLIILSIILYIKYVLI